jgi:hypothetical protein
MAMATIHITWSIVGLRTILLAAILACPSPNESVFENRKQNGGGKRRRGGERGKAKRRKGRERINQEAAPANGLPS